MFFNHFRFMHPVESGFEPSGAGRGTGLIHSCKSALPAVLIIGALAGTLVVSPALASRTHRSATSGHMKHKKKAASHQIHGQRQIDEDRAREIQSALIREHYMTGEPTGEWDADSQAAMTKYQSDHGWQTKITPDSRALIKLGLGPTQDAAPMKAALPQNSMSMNAPSVNTLADSHPMAQ